MQRIAKRTIDALPATGTERFVWDAELRGFGVRVLTGKYTRADLSDENAADVSPTRTGVVASSGHLNERSLAIADVVAGVAGESGATPSQVALAWTLTNPTVVSPIIGARTLAQAVDNLGALAVALSPDQLDRLQAVCAAAPTFPDRFMARPMVQQLMFSGTAIAARARNAA